MLQSDFNKEPHWLGKIFCWKVTDSRIICSWFFRRYLFFILLLGAVLFLYTTNMNGKASDWLLENTPKKLWITLKRLNEPAFSPEGITVGTDQTSNVPAVPYESPGQYLVEYPYEYHYIINEPKKCEQQKPFLVLMVPVAPDNRAHREIIRSTWGGESPVLGKVVTLLFLLGRHSGDGAEQLQEELLQESQEHQDLIQSDFLDCYKNLTIKTMVMLEWLDSHCSNASYAMKIDSDMFLNVPKLIDMLLQAPKTEYMTGLVARAAAVLRHPNSKWFLPEELYPYSHYPRYALGLGYVFTLDLPKKLVEASRHVKPLYLEDVFVGLCMEYLGIPPTNPPGWGSYFNIVPVPYSRCAYSNLIATTTDEQTDRMSVWKDFKKPVSYFTFLSYTIFRCLLM